MRAVATARKSPADVFSKRVASLGSRFLGCQSSPVANLPASCSSSLQRGAERLKRALAQRVVAHARRPARLVPSCCREPLLLTRPRAVCSAAPRGRSATTQPWITSGPGHRRRARDGSPLSPRHSSGRPACYRRSRRCRRCRCRSSMKTALFPPLATARRSVLRFSRDRRSRRQARAPGLPGDSGADGRARVVSERHVVGLDEPRQARGQGAASGSRSAAPARALAASSLSYRACFSGRGVARSGLLVVALGAPLFEPCDLPQMRGVASSSRRPRTLRPPLRRIAGESLGFA